MAGTAVGSKIQVYRSKAAHTVGGVKKEGLTKNKQGKIVSKKKSEQGKKQFKKLSAWNELVQRLYREGHVKGAAGLTAAMKKAKTIYHRK